MIATDPGVVIHIARLGHAYHGMNQQVGFDLLGGAECKLDVRAVHGIASLEGDHLSPADAGKLRADFGWSQAQVTKIIVGRNLGSFQLSSDVPGIRLVDGVIGARMSGASAGENCLGLCLAVGLPDFFHVQHCQHDSFRIAQRDLASARGKFLGKFLGDI